MADRRPMDVTRTYLEMRAPEELVPSDVEPVGARIERVDSCPPSFYRYLYSEVGRDYHWVDRLSWSDGQIRAHLQQSSITVWALWVKGAPAGWFELKRHDDGSVEIAYFGILPEFRRRGLGKHLLTAAVTQAWHIGARRVWLHTCTLDDPAALPNYRARGFTPYKEESYTVDL
jgi:ribosomal protein S18 acetylase RimI-like enzyme